VTVVTGPRPSRPARIAGTLAALAGCLFIGRALATEWREARAAVASADLGWLVAGLPLAMGGMAVIALTWGAAVRALGGRLGPRPAVIAYLRGELGKYVPGAVWAMVGRAELVARAGVSRAVAYAGTVLSLLAVYVGCALVALVFLPAGVDLDGSHRGLWVVPAVVGGLVLLHPAPWRRAFRLAGRAEHAAALPGWSDNLRLVVRGLPAWLLIGTATWCSARGLHADVTYQRVMLATAVSWLAGAVAVPVPGGVGVRETVFVAMASPLPSGIAAAVAVTARLTFVAADALGAALASLLSGRPGRSTAPPVPAPTPPTR
jgi:uncharacterized membrane protein YbhN (UPF0104 family)